MITQLQLINIIIITIMFQVQMVSEVQNSLNTVKMKCFKRRMHSVLSKKWLLLPVAKSLKCLLAGLSRDQILLDARFSAPYLLYNEY